MYRYRIYGIIIESEFEIAMLLPAQEDEDVQDVITVSEGDVEEEIMRILEDADAVGLRYTIGTEVSAFFNKGGFFLVRGGSEILLKIKEDYDHSSVSAWILGFALSMALLQRHILTIHCSAVVKDKGAVLISGTPGAGKSSLARKLIEDGYRMLADDVAAVRFENGECMVYPAFPYQKLCSNEVEKRGLDKDELEYIVGDKDKYLVPVSEIFEDRPKKLTHFFYIVKEDGGELSIRKQTGFDCFRTIKDNLFLHRLAGEWEAKPEVVSMSMQIASKCDVYRITRLDGVDTLDRIREEAEKIIDTKK